MDQPDDNTAHESKTGEKKLSTSSFRIVSFAVIAVLALVAGGLLYLDGGFSGGLNPVNRLGPDQGFETVPGAGEAREPPVPALEPVTEDLTRKQEGGKTADHAGAVQAPNEQLEMDVERLKKEIENLSTLLTALQAQMEEENRTSGAAIEDAQAALSMAVAFVQLRSAVDSGADFSKSLNALGRAAAHDREMKKLAAELEPLSGNNAPTLNVLREQFTSLEPAARAETRRAEAKTWKERLMAEIQRFVSVRPLNGSASKDDAVEAIRQDLDNRRLDAALQKTNALSPEVRNVLKDWLAKAEARQKIETVLAAMAAHLSGQEPDEQKQKQNAESETQG